MTLKNEPANETHHYFIGYTDRYRHLFACDWLNDNLQDAPGHPVYHEITAQWTFDGKWDPEQRLRDLWYVLAY